MADCKERGLDETLETIAQEYHLSLRSTYEAERTTAVVRAARVRMWKQLTSRMWTLNEVARFFSLDYGTIKSTLQHSPQPNLTATEISNLTEVAQDGLVVAWFKKDSEAYEYARDLEKRTERPVYVLPPKKST